jgi:hypothetical protein
VALPEVLVVAEAAAVAVVQPGERAALQSL